MATVRQVSPLPPGRYWMTITGPLAIGDFDAWVQDMAGAVRVETSELSHNGSQQFVIFRVPEGRAPFLDAGKFGFPNVAEPSVKSADDVEQLPEPEGLFGPGFALPNVSPLLIVLVLVVLAGSSSGRSRSYA